MRLFVLLLAAAPAMAQGPAVEFEVACRAGQVFGMVIKTERTGIFMVRWDPKICEGRDA